MTTQQRSKLLSEFEYLEGIGSNEFDSKDWIKFDRFVENREKENKTEEKLYTKEQLEEAYMVGKHGGKTQLYLDFEDWFKLITK